MKKQVIGHKIIKLDSVESTNIYGIGLLKDKKIEEGTVIFARSQTQGKGLNGNIWESESNKNITISVILYPIFLPPEKHFYLNIISSLAIVDYVTASITSFPVAIKWPNDIYINRSKLAGILIKNGVKGNEIEYSILGLGVNMNQMEFRSNAPNPISLKSITLKHYDLEKSLKELCIYLDKRYQQLKEQRFNDLMHAYRDALLFFNKKGKYIYKNALIYATIINVEEDGILVLKDEEGRDLRCDFKEIEYLFN